MSSYEESEVVEVGWSASAAMLATTSMTVVPSGLGFQ